MAKPTPSLPGFKAVVLDMDGLVLDTEPGYLLAWQVAARQLGYQLEEAHCLSLSGQSGEHIEQSMRRYCGAEFPFELFLQRASTIWQSNVEQQGIQPMPGFFTLMNILKDQQLPYCLATNSRRNNAQQCLQLAKVEAYFPLIATRDEVNHGKPAPDVFLLAARLLGLPSDQCLAVEDTNIGLLAARRAGMIPVLITNKPTSDQPVRQNASLALSSLSELAAWLTQNPNLQ